MKTFRLINNEGSLLAYAGPDIGNDAIGAIVSNIWSSTEGNEQLEYVIIQCEVKKHTILIWMDS